MATARFHALAYTHPHDVPVPNCRWHELSDPVYNALVNDFMKPRIDEASDPARDPMKRWMDLENVKLY